MTAAVVGSEYALHDGATGRVHFLNATAALVWDLADGVLTAEQIGDEIAARCTDGASRDAILCDVAEVLELLAREGLITWSAA